MVLFAVSWKIFDDKRSDAATVFSSMTDEDHVKQMGPDIKMHTRVHNLANLTGLWVGEAKDAKAIYKFIWEWTEDMADMKVEPVLDDNMVRETILGHAPSWRRAHDYQNAKDGEVLYLARFEFENCDSKIKGYDLIANMTQEQWETDHGACRPMGVWHNIASGTGYCLCAAASSMDAARWAYNWAPLAKIDLEAVIMDKEAVEIVKEKEGYDKKLSTMMAKMGM